MLALTHHLSRVRKSYRPIPINRSNLNPSRSFSPSCLHTIRRPLNPHFVSKRFFSSEKDAKDPAPKEVKTDEKKEEEKKPPEPVIVDWQFERPAKNYSWHVRGEDEFEELEKMDLNEDPPIGVKKIQKRPVMPPLSNRQREAGNFTLNKRGDYPDVQYSRYVAKDDDSLWIQPANNPVSQERIFRAKENLEGGIERMKQKEKEEKMRLAKQKQEAKGEAEPPSEEKPKVTPYYELPESERLVKFEPSIRYGVFYEHTDRSAPSNAKERWQGNVGYLPKKSLLSRLLFALLTVVGAAGLYSLYDMDTVKDNLRYIEFRIKTGIRFLRCTWTAGLMAVDYQRTIWNMEKEENEEETKAMLSQAHSRSAMRLLHLFEKNEGIFIKAGQHMSALTYVLPKEYCMAMIPLFEKAPFHTWEETERVFVEEFGAKPDQLFEEFEKTPTSSASMAQVHRAVYKNKPVAVKIQHSGLADQCISDVRTIEIIVNFVAQIFPQFKLKWLIDEFNRNLPNELDFIQEARNATKAQRNLEKSGIKNAKVPDIVWERSTPRILCMEWIEGVPLYNVERIKEMGVSPDAVAQVLTDVFNDQIFRHGFVHCDPHPGNVFVRKTPRDFEIVLLDNGLYRQYDDDFRIDYANLWWSIYNADEDGIKKYTKKLAGTDSYELFASMLTTRAMDRAKFGGGFKSYAKLYSSALTADEIASLQATAAGGVVEITQILATVPPALLLLFKTNDLLRSVTAKLVSPEASLRVLTTTMRYCLWAIHRHSLRTGNDGILQRITALFSEAKLYVQLNVYQLLLKYFLIQ